MNLRYPEYWQTFGADIGDEIRDVDQPQFGGNRLKPCRASRKFDLIADNTEILTSAMERSHFGDTRR
jgi:hypothetical protein